MCTSSTILRDSFEFFTKLFETKLFRSKDTLALLDINSSKAVVNLDLVFCFNKKKYSTEVY